jgi:hypothetical protein
MPRLGPPRLVAGWVCPLARMGCLGLAVFVDRSAPVGCIDLRLWRLLPPESGELALSPVTPLGRCAAVKAGRSDRAQAKRIAHSDAVLGPAEMAVSATERPLNLDALTPAFEWSACEIRIHSIGGCNGGKRLSRGRHGVPSPLADVRPDEFRNADPRTASKRWSGSKRSCWVFGVVVTSLHTQTCVPLRPPTSPVDVPAPHSQNSTLDTDP